MHGSSPDDFVILSRGCAAEALAWTKAVMSRLGLTLNEAKTSLRDARQERFDFLGYEASARAVTRTSRSSASGSIDNSPGGIFLH